MTAPSPRLLAGLTVPIVFTLLFLVLPLQALAGGRLARLIGFAGAYLVARWMASWRRVDVGQLGWVRPSVRSIVFGWVVGGGLVATVAAVMAGAGWYSWSWSGAWSNLLGALSFAAVVGLYEEALFRSLWFGGLEPALGTWLTLAISAVLFGFLHSFNPDATIVSSVSVALSGGLLLGAAFVARRDLWFVASIHAAWNAFLGGVLGMPVSGNDPTDALLTAVEGGPDLWTGGAFGPEASLITIAVVGGAGFWFIWRAHSSATVTPPPWREPATRSPEH